MMAWIKPKCRHGFSDCSLCRMVREHRSAERRDTLRMWVVAAFTIAGLLCLGIPAMELVWEVWR